MTKDTDFEKMENDTVDKVCELLNGHEDAVRSYLADFVANICNVSVDKMLSETSVAYMSQARAFYWYALRYMTNETYDKLSEYTVSHGGYRFTPNGIGQAINKMNALIEKEPIWKKRWFIIRKIIKKFHASSACTYRPDGETKDVRVVVYRPKGVDVKVELKDE